MSSSSVAISACSLREAHASPDWQTLTELTMFGGDMLPMAEKCLEGNIAATVYVARDGDVIVGWLLLVPHYLKDRRESALYVRPDRRREGIGTKLMRTMLREEAPIDPIVTPWNMASRAFYEKLGFRKKLSARNGPAAELGSPA